MASAMLIAGVSGAETAALSTSVTTTTMAQSAGAGGQCVDSDGGKVYNVHGVTNGVNGRFDDKCRNQDTLEEYYCDGAKVKMEIYTCTGGCFAGACSSKGGTTGASTTTTSGASSTTTTLSSTALPAVVLGSTATTLTTVTTLVAPLVSGKCSDSDGGQNFYIKGTTKGINGEFNDVCNVRRRLREYYCDGDKVASLFTICVEGCSNGACKGNATQTTMVTQTTTVTSMTTTTTLSSTATTTTLKATTTTAAAAAGTCVDSDGGKVYNVHGVTNGVNGRFDDKCRNQDTLQEYYCDGAKVKMEIYTCDGGCFAGACNSQGGSTGVTTTTMAKVTTTTLSK